MREYLATYLIVVRMVRFDVQAVVCTLVQAKAFKRVLNNADIIVFGKQEIKNDNQYVVKYTSFLVTITPLLAFDFDFDFDCIRVQKTVVLIYFLR